MISLYVQNPYYYIPIVKAVADLVRESRTASGSFDPVHVGEVIAYSVAYGLTISLETGAYYSPFYHPILQTVISTLLKFVPS